MSLMVKLINHTETLARKFIGIFGTVGAIVICFVSSISVNAAQSDGFLFVTFKNGTSSASEQIYFGLSKDGREWEALNGSMPVLYNSVGNKGARDPYLLRANDGKKFYLLATNLSMRATKDWALAKSKGSRSIIIWESRNLTTWSKPRLAMVAPVDAGCVWAPEAIYDDEQKNYLVFWASTSKSDGYSKFRIWASRTTNFINFSKPFVYIDKPMTTIDTTIIRENGQYYRFTKDEKYKAITMEAAPQLSGPWGDVPGFSLSGLKGVEGPQAYKSFEGDPAKPSQWTLIVDRYSTQEGYAPFVANDLSSGKFVAGIGFKFPFQFRHGSVLGISRNEYRGLQARYGLANVGDIPPISQER